MVFSLMSTIPFMFGPGASAQTGAKAKEFGLTKVFCVYDKGVKSAGVSEKIVKSLKEAGLEVVEYDGVLADPPDTMINEAAAIALAAKVDGIVAVGGGSSMDAAKSINILMGNPGPISTYFDMSVAQKPGLPLILIPTTSGTGSEVTGVSVVSNTAKGVKTGTRGPATHATLSIIDPELTLGLPPAITAATGMDAMSHAVESYTGSQSNMMTELLAGKAISLLAENLPKAVKNGSDLEARTNVMFAATLAGIAFDNAMVHWGHAIAHVIGAFHHIPHGIGCALAMPAAVQYVAQTAGDRLPGVAKALGMTLAEGLSAQEMGNAIAAEITRLNKDLGIPCLADLGITEQDLDRIAEAVPNDVVAMFAPKTATKEEAYGMMQYVYTQYTI